MKNRRAELYQFSIKINLYLNLQCYFSKPCSIRYFRRKEIIYPSIAEIQRNLLTSYMFLDDQRCKPNS